MMSYKSELEEHYKRVRARLMMNGLRPERAPLLLAAPSVGVGGIAGSTGVTPPKAAREAEESFIPIRTDKNATCLGARVDDEVEWSPKLPPLKDPASDLGNISIWRRVVAAVARAHDVSPEEILSKKRCHNIVEARMECMYRMRIDLRMSYLNIASKLGRDHSTVIHGVRKVRTKLLDEIAQKADAGDPVLMTLRPEAGRLPELVVA